MNSNQLQLNRAAQGVVSIESTLQWFEGLAKPDREVVLKDLAYICHQAHPTTNEVESAISRAGLKQTFTPCVLLRKVAPAERALQHIIALPQSEHTKAFRLLLALFSVADERRRATQCKDGCTHAWHNLAPGGMRHQ